MSGSIQLRENIGKEQLALEEITKNKQKMAVSMSQKILMSRYSTDGAKLYKRKLENCQIEARTLECKLTEANQGNTKLLESIRE
jgi:hypothetical protein